MITAQQLRDNIAGLLASLGVPCIVYRGVEKIAFNGLGGNQKKTQTDDFGSGGIRETTKVVCSDEVPFIPEIGFSIDVSGKRHAVVSVSQSPCGGNWTLGLSDSFSTRATVSTRARIVRNTAAAPKGSSFSIFLIWNDGDLIAPQSDAWIASGDSEAVLHVRKHDWPGDSAPDREMIFTRDDGVSVTASNVVRTTYGWRISAKFRRGE